MSIDPNWQGRTLQAALTEQPSLSLDFYSYGVMLRKREGEMLTAYAVDPAPALCRGLGQAGGALRSERSPYRHHRPHLYLSAHLSAAR